MIYNIEFLILEEGERIDTSNYKNTLLVMNGNDGISMSIQGGKDGTYPTEAFSEIEVEESFRKYFSKDNIIDIDLETKRLTDALIVANALIDSYKSKEEARLKQKEEDAELFVGLLKTQDETNEKMATLECIQEEDPKKQMIKDIIFDPEIISFNIDFYIDDKETDSSYNLILDMKKVRR